MERGSMTTDREVYRLALVLVDSYGRDAGLEATLRADDSAVAGNRDGFATWVRIMTAIDELQRTQRSQGEPLN